jgi:hypothetical protein
MLSLQEPVRRIRSMLCPEGSQRSGGAGLRLPEPYLREIPVFGYVDAIKTAEFETGAGSRAWAGNDGRWVSYDIVSDAKDSLRRCQVGVWRALHLAYGSLVVSV